MSAYKITVFGVLLLVVSIGVANGKLPSDVKACKPGDKDCLIQTINKIIETKYQGDDELNLVSIDPLKVDRLELKKSPTSPVSVAITMTDSEILGYKEMRAVDVSGFGESPDGKHEILFQGPYAMLQGDYTIDGNVIILPIKGQGKTNLTLDSYYYRVGITGASKIKDGNTYFDVKKMRYDINTTRLHLHFTNLFNGDKALGDNMNKFLNENWSDIYQELKPGFLNAIGEVVTDVIRKVLTAFPYNVLLDIEK